jgi:hypothetical protein
MLVPKAARQLLFSWIVINFRSLASPDISAGQIQLSRRGVYQEWLYLRFPFSLLMI